MAIAHHDQSARNVRAASTCVGILLVKKSEPLERMPPPTHHHPARHPTRTPIKLLKAILSKHRITPQQHNVVSTLQTLH